MVANNGDGRIALFAGGEGGLALRDAEANGNLPHPTALALAQFGSQFLEIYVSTEGREAVDRISLSFNVPVAELVPLDTQELALVATLLATDVFPAGATSDVRLETSNLRSEAALASFQPDSQPLEAA